MEGSVLVVTMRMSVNVDTTIEQVVAKMQRSHLQLLDLVIDDLSYAGAPIA